MKRSGGLRKGVTLVELVIVLGFVSVIILASANMVILGTKAEKVTVDEYKLQSAIRRLTEQVNQTVRYSKAVFAVPETFVESTSVMDPGWSYFMVSSDQRSIVVWRYDTESAQWLQETIVEPVENVAFALRFYKDESADSDSVLRYVISAYRTDSGGNITSEKTVFESTIEAVNSVQVADKGTVASPSVALAFRGDGQTSGQGKNEIAYITIVVDVSGSMNQLPDGIGSSGTEQPGSRIRHLRKALAGDAANPDSGIIQILSKEENIFVSLIPFSTTANYPNPVSYSATGGDYGIYEVYNKSEEDTLINIAKSLRAYGGTNTGDGLRRAYHMHNDFRTKMGIDSKTRVHHYMIVLVDGETTYEVKKGTWERRSLLRWEFSPSSQYYLDLGNIDILFSGQPVYFHDPRVTYAITGNGSTVINSSPHVSAAGALIKSFDGGNGVKSYLIGYAADLSTHINFIGSAIGTDPEHIYKYDDEGFDLEEVFENIATDIMADFWIVSGPQIIK